MKDSNSNETAEVSPTRKRLLKCDECEFTTENGRGLKTHISRIQKIPKCEGFDDLDLKDGVCDTCFLCLSTRSYCHNELRKHTYEEDYRKKPNQSKQN